MPREVVYSCKHYRRQMMGLQVPRNVYIAVCGTDLIRLESGEFVVLEDNLRVPSGVSYMLTNRRVMKRIFPQLFRSYNVSRLSNTRNCYWGRSVRWHQRVGQSLISCCCRRGYSTQLTSSMHTLRDRWGLSWSKDATS